MAKREKGKDRTEREMFGRRGKGGSGEERRHTCMNFEVESSIVKYGDGPTGNIVNKN